MKRTLRQPGVPCPRSLVLEAKDLGSWFMADGPRALINPPQAKHPTPKTTALDGSEGKGPRRQARRLSSRHPSYQGQGGIPWKTVIVDHVRRPWSVDRCATNIDQGPNGCAQHYRLDRYCIDQVISSRGRWARENQPS